MVKRLEQGVAEINRDAEMVIRALDGEGLSFRNGGDSLEVTRAAPSLMRLRVTHRGQSVSAEWVTETGGGQGATGESHFKFRCLPDVRPHPEERERGGDGPGRGHQVPAHAAADGPAIARPASCRRSAAGAYQNSYHQNSTGILMKKKNSSGGLPAEQPPADGHLCRVR